MSVVQLDGDLVGELLPRALALLEAANNVVERSSAPEVLLLEAKLLTALKVVVGVQNSGNGFSTLLVRYRTLILARVELLEIEFAASSLAAPETEVVAGTGLVTRDRDIISHSLDNLATLPRGLLLALIVLPAIYVAVELDVNCDVVSLKFPWVEVEPVIWDFNLVSVNDLLLEDTVSVSQTVAPSWVVQGGHRIEEASGETSKTTITKSSVVLLRDYIFHAESEIGKALYNLVSEANGCSSASKDSLVAMSFCSTLSIALSRARPIKNSRDRSVRVSTHF